jgi:hypothetical protein
LLTFRLLKVPVVPVISFEIDTLSKEPNGLVIDSVAYKYVKEADAPFIPSVNDEVIADLTQEVVGTLSELSVVGNSDTIFLT